MYREGKIADGELPTYPQPAWTGLLYPPHRPFPHPAGTDWNIVSFCWLGLILSVKTCKTHQWREINSSTKTKKKLAGFFYIEINHLLDFWLKSSIYTREVKPLELNFCLLYTMFWKDSPIQSSLLFIYLDVLYIHCKGKLSVPRRSLGGMLLVQQKVTFELRSACIIAQHQCPHG